MVHLNSDRISLLLLLPVAALFVLLYSLSGSPLYVCEGTDGNVFKIIGSAILQGKLPYVDIFDHKGPLIFYIFALARLISVGKIGIFIIQVAFTYVMMDYQYKIGRIFLNTLQTWVTILLQLIFIAIMIDDGTQVEYFELPFIYIVLYYTIKIFNSFDRRLLYRWSIIIGAALACVFLIRINDAVCQIGMVCLCTCIYIFKRYDLQTASLFTGYGFLGFMAVILPFAIYFVAKHMLSDVWYGMYTFNALYAGAGQMFNVLNFPLIKIIVISMLAVCGISAWVMHKHVVLVKWLVLPVTLVSSVLIGNNSYPHYYMVVAPMFGLLTILCYNRCFVLLVSWLLVVNGLSLGYNKGSLISVSHDFYRAYKRNADDADIHRSMLALISNVPAEERGQVWNYNLWNTILMEFFTISDITPANKYFVPLHKFYYPAITEYESIPKNRPKWIIVDSNSNLSYIKPEDMSYINDNYDMVATADAGNVILQLFRIR